MNTIIPLLVCTTCYGFCFWGNMKQKDYPHALMWFSYSLANVGLLWYEINKWRTSS